MTTALTEKLDTALPAGQHPTMEAVLRGMFGVEFQLWPPAARPLRVKWKSPPAAGFGPPGGEIHATLFEQAAQPGTDHVIARVGAAEWLVVLPIRGAAELELLASAVIHTSDPDLLVRLVLQARKQIDMQRRLQLLSEERDQLICQITADLEELTFLRRTAEHLSLADMSLDINQLAQVVFPQLREQLHAEAVVLVSAGRDKASCLVGRPVVSVGHNRLDDRACTRLVEQFRDVAVRQPVVRNGCQEAPEFQGIKGLRSFILAPMVRSNSVIAWVLAVNRLYTLGDVSDNSPGHQSSREFGVNEVSLLRSTAAILATHATNIDLFHDKEQLFLDMVRALVNAVEAKDRYTFGHSERVGLYAKHLGASLGLKAKVCQRIYLAGLLHDVGKIAVRDNLLATCQRLDEDEFADIQRHAEEGWGILYGLEALDDVLVGVLHHHERWDGRGYPDGLREDMIPHDARILAVADAYDAMTSDRPYRKALQQEQAEEILRQGAGTQWDPDIVEVFLQIMPETLRIRNNYEPRRPPARRGYAMLRGLDLEV
jgi:HD-GYP domain-containing protein (c-di-GMP phosphodiesterase class II)